MAKRLQKTKTPRQQTRSHRAQITIFITLAILIIVLAASFILLTQPNNPKGKPVNLPVQEMISDQLMIESANLCLRETGESAARIVALQGGYWGLPPDGADAVYFGTPFLFTNNQTQLMTAQKNEDSISLGVDTNILDCLSAKGADLSRVKGRPNTKTVLTGKEVVLFIELPIVSTTKESVTIIRSFTQKINLPILRTLNLTNEILALQKMDPESIPASDLVKIMDREDGTFYLMMTAPREYVYFFTLNTKPDPLNFAFAVRLEPTGESNER